VMGGQAEQIARYVQSRYSDGLTLAQALRLAVDGLANDTGGAPRNVPATQLEVAVLDRDRPRRKFRRLSRAALEQLLSDETSAELTQAQCAQPPDGSGPTEEPGEAEHA
jgi:proteasome alpha subunit